jgi:hypothetical protein
MVRLFVRHMVEDFEKWHRGYAEGADSRKEAGVEADGVHQAVDDPNDVTIFHDFPDYATAYAFATSDDLKQKMDDIGVKGEPTIWMTEQV